jgi:hypothetical protein
VLGSLAVGEQRKMETFVKGLCKTHTHHQMSFLFLLLLLLLLLFVKWLFWSDSSYFYSREIFD